METNSYKGWLNSDSFIKRVLGVYFYNLLASTVIGCFLYIIIFVILFLTGFLGTMLASMPPQSTQQTTTNSNQNQNFR